MTGNEDGARAGQTAGSESRPAAAGFRLVRYYTLASLVAFAVMVVALFYLEGKEADFFKQAQEEQNLFFRRVQDGFGRQQDAAARRDLLAVHEAGNVNLTRLLANALWETEIEPLVARAQKIPVDHCRAIGEVTDAQGKPVKPEEKKACFAGVGRRIMALPGFQSLDARVRDAMKKSTVFKVKVFDLRGITVYSSEHGQIGEDSRRNYGWMSAAGGTPASELTHRGRFSAFEGMVENRDLISSYAPVLAPGLETVVGVFEIYADVTAFLEQIRSTSAQIEALSAANQTRVAQAGRENLKTVETDSSWLLATMIALLTFFYFVLLLVVRNGQAIIDRRERERELAVTREQRWHREKMAALGTMAAGIAHEIGNPLATISAVAENISEREARGECRDCGAAMLLEQTRRIAGMTRQIADFAASHGVDREPVDVNQIVKSVCDFARFDRRFRATDIVFRAATGLPTRIIVPDHLTEVLMNLMQTCAEGHSGSTGRPEQVRLETELRGDDVIIRFDCSLPGGGGILSAEDEIAGARMALTRRLVESMAGRFLVNPAQHAALEIVLPPSHATPAGT